MMCRKSLTYHLDHWVQLWRRQACLYLSQMMEGGLVVVSHVSRVSLETRAV